MTSAAAKKAWESRRRHSGKQTRKSHKSKSTRFPRGVKFPYYDKETDILWQSRHAGFRHPKKWKGHEAIMGYLGTNPGSRD